MRILLLLMGCVAFISSAGQYRSFFNLDHTATIEGKIRSYKPRENNRFITLRTFDVSGRKKDTAIQIRPDGSFYARFIMPYPNDIQVGYSGAYITLLVRNDSRNNFDIDDKLWVANENKSLAFIPLDEMSRYSATVLDFNFQLSKQTFKTEVNWFDKNKTDEELVNLKLQKLQEELQYLEKYGKQTKTTGYYGIRWKKNDMQLEAAKEIAFELFSSSRRNSYTHDQLFGLLKHFPIDSTMSCLSSNYYAFAQLFAADLAIIYNMNPGLESLRKQSVQNVFPYLLDKIDSTDKSNSTSIWHKLLYYHLYFEYPPAQTAFYETRFYGKINDQLLRNRMDLYKANQQKAFVEFNLLDKLKNYDVDASLKNRLIGLLESQRDKYVFMDFWGTWCGPCMREMPHYAQFINGLKNKNISFFFMGVNTPEADALKVKEKYKIDGNFITLNDSEVSILGNLLAIKGYPTHVLLKPGSLVSGYTGENISWGDHFNPGSVKKIESYLTGTQ